MSEKNCMFKVSEKNYIFMFRNGDGAEYSCDSQWEAIDFARSVFDGDQPFAIHRVIIKLHEIGTMKKGTFTPAKQEPTIEDTLLDACETVVNDCDAILDADDMSSMCDEELISVMKQTLTAAIAKAKGGAV